jgi:hypothetical protein
MKNIIITATAAIFLFTACATFTGKWSDSKIDALSEKCLAENDERKPETSRLHNLSTQARSRKKREVAEYRKKRIELYQAIQNFRSIYLTHVESDGKCRKNECRSLDKFRLLVIAGCPGTGESLPRVKSE